MGASPMLNSTGEAPVPRLIFRPAMKHRADPAFRKMIQEARESFRKHGGISGDELRRQLGLPAAKKVPPPRNSKIRASIMKSIDMAKSRRPLASFIKELEGGDPIVITKNGKTIAALVPLTDMDWESFAVSTNPIFKKIIEEARRSFKLHGGLSTEEVCEQLGIKLPKRRNGVNKAMASRKAG